MYQNTKSHLLRAVHIAPIILATTFGLLAPMPQIIGTANIEMRGQTSTTTQTQSKLPFAKCKVTSKAKAQKLLKKENPGVSIRYEKKSASGWWFDIHWGDGGALALVRKDCSISYNQ